MNMLSCASRGQVEEDVFAQGQGEEGPGGECAADTCPHPSRPRGPPSQPAGPHWSTIASQAQGKEGPKGGCAANTCPGALRCHRASQAAGPAPLLLQGPAHAAAAVPLQPAAPVVAVSLAGPAAGQPGQATQLREAP